MCIPDPGSTMHEKARAGEGGSCGCVQPASVSGFVRGKNEVTENNIKVNIDK